jgi:hypothetical protein
MSEVAQIGGVLPRLIKLDLVDDDFHLELSKHDQDKSFRSAFWHAHDDGFEISNITRSYPRNLASKISQIYEKPKPVMFYARFSVDIITELSRSYEHYALSGWMTRPPPRMAHGHAVRYHLRHSPFRRHQIKVYVNLSTREILSCSPEIDTETLVKDLDPH